MGEIVLKNCIIADGIDTFIPDGVLVISGDKIEALGSAEQFAGRDFTGYEIIDLRGRLVLPGFLIAHHHLYSALATGLSPAGPTQNFVQILQNLWWRLDRTLDEETIYYSALAGVMEAVSRGATVIFDHHASMNFVKGSLDIIAEVFKLAGIKGVLCFETSDRNGAEQVDSHIEENISFYERHIDDENIKGVFGLHANFTLSEETLRKIAEVKPKNMPIHIHCGEDKYDFQFCTDLGYSGPVDRLYKFGLLDENSILAHCVHLSEADYKILEEISPVVAANFESNANNRVGKMNRQKIARYLLGTDGITGDMLLTLRSAYFLNAPDGITFEELKSAFFEYRLQVQERFFPKSGRLFPGYKADIAVLNYIPTTEINESNLMAHLIFGDRTGKVFMTISNGEIIYKDGQFSFIDVDEVFPKIRRASEKLWKKFREI